MSLNLKDLLCPHLIETAQIIEILKEHHIPVQDAMQRDVLIQLLYQHVVPKPQRLSAFKIAVAAQNPVDPARKLAVRNCGDEENNNHKKQRLNSDNTMGGVPNSLKRVSQGGIDQATPSKRVKIVWP